MSTIEVMPARLTREETEDLSRAVACLEGTSFAQRLTDAIGRPLGMVSRTLPESARRAIAHASETALRGALKLALRTIDLNASAKAGARAHKLAAAFSGALGGAFGLAALPVELPISTTILLRSIAEIAREEGEDLNAPNAALACVEVLALGGRQDEEAAFESGYFAVRAALARSVSDSARFVAEQGLERAIGAGRGAAHLANRRALRRRGQRKARRAGGPDPRRDRRRDGQRRLRRPFPDPRPRPFHRAAPGARAWGQPGRVRIPAAARRAGARGLGLATRRVLKASVHEIREEWICADERKFACSRHASSRPGRSGLRARTSLRSGGKRGRARRSEAAGQAARRAADALRARDERRPRVRAQLPRVAFGRGQDRNPARRGPSPRRSIGSTAAGCRSSFILRAARSPTR